MLLATPALADLDAFNDAYDKLVLSSGTATVGQLPPPSTAQKQKIQQVLIGAGMAAPIADIVPSKLPSMYQVTLAAQGGQPQPPLHISADGQYILQGVLQDNPSPKQSTPPTAKPSQMLSGMPVSASLRESLLANSSQLKNITSDASFYHTAVPGVIWGITVEGMPFLTNMDASVFTNAEISVIKNGQFSGLDSQFEQRKNQYILSKLNEDDLVVYPATGAEKAVIYVATDINCPYCRIMHNDMQQLNNKGITVKVIGFPVYDESQIPMRQIWCETDKAARRQALDTAMQGEEVNLSCNGFNDINDSPLVASQQLAAGLVVDATPAIYREDGVPFQAPYSDPNFFPFLGIN
ncbi:hypothetical protein A6J60_007965 [Psychrobacter sp. FDAARGOS_221]|nr:hypothetical protein A6J60_007965 [Psychrobacter sp. FDAARGOS_221]